MAALVKSRTGTLGHERMTIRKFASHDLMYSFLNRQCDNSWTEYSGELPPGVYAFVGGQWRNVRHLDPLLLSHV